MKEKDLLGEKMDHVWARGLCSKKPVKRVHTSESFLAYQRWQEGRTASRNVMLALSQPRECYERPGETQPKVLCFLGTHCLRVSVATGACDFGLWGAAAWTIYCHLGLPHLR